MASLAGDFLRSWRSLKPAPTRLFLARRRAPMDDSDAKRKEALRLLGRKVADLRQQRGMSQRQLAAAIGRHVNSLSKWETGAQEMGALDAQALAKALATSVQDLLQPSGGVPL